MAFDSEKDVHSQNEKLINRPNFIRVDQLTELLSQIPEDHFLIANSIGNLSILSGPHFKYVGYIDLGASLLDYFPGNVS